MPIQHNCLSNSVQQVVMQLPVQQVRAARNLPIKMLAGEYNRILTRRLKSVGGSPTDPGLRDMLLNFECGPALASAVRDHEL